MPQTIASSFPYHSAYLFDFSIMSPLEQWSHTQPIGQWSGQWSTSSFWGKTSIRRIIPPLYAEEGRYSQIRKLTSHKGDAHCFVPIGASPTKRRPWRMWTWSLPARFQPRPSILQAPKTNNRRSPCLTDSDEVAKVKQNQCDRFFAV